MGLALQDRGRICTERTIKQILAGPIVELHVMCHGSTDGCLGKERVHPCLSWVP